METIEQLRKSPTTHSPATTKLVTLKTPVKSSFMVDGMCAVLTFLLGKVFVLFFLSRENHALVTHFPPDIVYFLPKTHHQPPLLLLLNQTMNDTWRSRLKEILHITADPFLRTFTNYTPTTKNKSTVSSTTPTMLLNRHSKTQSSSPWKSRCSGH